MVFAASLLGILTRPVGFLAALWPANALLLGIMVRDRRLASVLCWAAAFAAYVAADLATGGELGITLWLTTANLAGVAAGYGIYSLISDEDRRLKRPLSILYMFLAAAVAAIVAALTGGGAARLLFGRDFLAGFELWFVTELVNSIVILPVVLTLPALSAPIVTWPVRWTAGTLRRAAPAAALAVSCVASAVVGGPGAVAFPVPALIWCALSYRLFGTAICTALTSAWLLIGTSAGIILLPGLPDPLASLNSIRLGVALIALGPLTIASVNNARNALLAKLSYAADHDALTGVLSRRTFMGRGYEQVARLSRGGRPLALLMLDLDHFKQINDTHGHAVGDKALVAFARVVSGVLRQEDLFGRLGGEEFAAVLPGAGMAEAAAMAERIRLAVASAHVPVADNVEARISVSIGVSVTHGVPGACLDQLISASDRALYCAKSGGRNKVHLAA